MVGKPNLPEESDQLKSEVQGASTATPGLTPLDQEREASMADEGGASGAEMEYQPAQSVGLQLGEGSSEPEHTPLSFAQWNLRQRIQRAGQQRWGFVAGLVVGALAGGAFVRNRSSRDQSDDSDLARDASPGIH